VLNALALGRGRWRNAWLPITAGALMPDLPMVAFYVYQRFLDTPEALIWSDIYFQPNWQLLFDLFNSLPLLGLAALVSWSVGSRGLLVFFVSMIFHCLADLPLHHDDAHAHFLPLSNWRFQSPVSYWDPRYHGRVLALIEMMLVLGGAGSLALGSRTRPWRVVGALTATSYIFFLTYAVITWL